jgi:hypothetical protein
VLKSAGAGAENGLVPRLAPMSLVVVMAAIVLLVPGRAASAGPANGAPSTGATVVQVGAGAARLTATRRVGRRTTVRFEYGRTLAYGRAVVRGGAGVLTRPVSRS